MTKVVRLSESELKDLIVSIVSEAKKDNNFIQKAVSKQEKKGEKLYSLRVTQKCRAVAIREGDYPRLLSLH
jgi:hypothetical protein